MNNLSHFRFAEDFYETIAVKSKSFKAVYEHFKLKGFNYLELFHDMTTKLFITYLPLNVTLSFILKLVIKIFVMYLNEGVKIYYRISYAIVVMLKVKIKDNLL